MEVKEMKELIAAVSTANVDEFEYNNEEFSIRIAKKKAKIVTVDASVAGVPVQNAAIMPEQSEEQPEEVLYGDEIKAPLVWYILCSAIRRSRTIRIRWRQS